MSSCIRPWGVCGRAFSNGFDFRALAKRNGVEKAGSPLGFGSSVRLSSVMQPNGRLYRKVCHVLNSGVELNAAVSTTLGAGPPLDWQSC